MGAKHHPLSARLTAVRRYEEGDKVDDILRDAGVGYTALYRWLRAMDVPLRGPTAKNVSRKVTRSGAQAREALVRKCVALYATMSAEQVSHETGVSVSTVLRYVRAAGGTVRPQKKGNLP